jgi:hypothetical protein
MQCVKQIVPYESHLLLVNCFRWAESSGAVRLSRITLRASLSLIMGHRGILWDDSLGAQGRLLQIEPQRANCRTAFDQHRSRSGFQLLQPKEHETIKLSKDVPGARP